MIRRFLYLLLVPLMLVNQALCIAHSHHGTDVAEPKGRASQPHVHVGGHGHHDSANDQQNDGDHPGHDQRSDDNDATVSPAVMPVCDHDADALYCAGTVTFVRSGHLVNTLIQSAKHIAMAGVLHDADQNGDALLRLRPMVDRPSAVSGSAGPIYLRTLSLRI